MSSEPESTSTETTVEETPQPIVLQEPKGVSAYARAVFRKLQASLDTGRDEDCFNMVQQLLRELPYDEPLNALARQLGKNLYKTAAEQLPAVLAGGRLSQVTQLVNKLRSMADEKDLENLVGYRDAAAMVDAAERKRWQSSLLSAMTKMREASDLKAREDLALSIEMFAQEKRLTLTPEQMAQITRVHEDWCRYCRLQKLRAEYNRQREAFHATEKNVTLRHDLPNCEKELHQHYLDTDRIKELPEALELRELIEKQQKIVRSVLTARHRRKVIIRTTICVVVTTALLIAATLVYTYMRADSLKKGIESGMAEKRVLDVSQLVGGIDLMRNFCESMHPGYAEALKKGNDWLLVFNDYQKQIEELTPALSESTDMLTKSDVSAADLTSGLVLVEKVRKIEDKLKAEYATEASEEPRILMGKYHERLAEIRPKVLERFRTPTPGIDMESLKSLYAEFLACTTLLNVTEDEAAAVRSAVQSAAAVALNGMSRRSLEPQQAREAVDEYDRYADSLPLGEELRRTLVAYADRTQALAALPETLKSVTDMQGFVAAVEACGECYRSVEGAFSADAARQLVGKENDALRAYQLADFRSAESHPLSAEQILPHLQAVKSIYAESGNAYQLSTPKSLKFVVNRFFANPNNVWNDGYHAVIIGKSVVIGQLNKGARTIRIVNNKNKPLTYNNPRKLTQAQIDAAVPQHPAAVRKAIGFAQSDISEGKVPPVRLMRDIAACKEPGCPIQARAYLFELASMLAKTMDPYSSGMAFSESLRQDIIEFENLVARNTLYPGCWLNMHEVAVDTEFEKFFNKVATRDYSAEILRAVMTITDSQLLYAGYVGKDGKVVRCKEGDEQLYIIKDGKLAPFNGSAEPIYTPLFNVVLPK